MKAVIFVYNPISGKATIGDKLEYIITQYQNAGYTLIPYRTIHRSGDWEERLSPLIAELKPCHILLGGGDGTVNQWVNFAQKANIHTPIAILPLGTANDFAGMLGISSNLNRAVGQIINGSIRNIDLGRVNDKYFINILSSGLMTEVSQNTPTAMKNIFGRVAYYFSVMGELPSFKKINITMSEPSGAVRFSGQCLLYMVLNGRTAGNLPMAVDASADDGLLEVLIFKGENIAATIGDLFHILVKQSSDYPDDVVYFQSSRLKVTIKGLATTDIDGDKGSHYPLDIECLKGELQIIC